MLSVEWTPSPNCSSANRQVGQVRGIVCHSTECDTAATIATFLRPGGVSAHYVLTSEGSAIQMVAESDVAYHCAAFGNDPRLNRNKPDWCPVYDGRYSAINKSSIGIELVGYAAKGFTGAQYTALASLLLGICDRWHLAPTLLPDEGSAATIVTHGWLQTDRSDPGPHFDWDQLRALLTPAAADTTGDDDMALLTDDQRALLGKMDALGAGSDSIDKWLSRLGRAAEIGKTLKATKRLSSRQYQALADELSHLAD